MQRTMKSAKREMERKVLSITWRDGKRASCMDSEFRRQTKVEDIVFVHITHNSSSYPSKATWTTILATFSFVAIVISASFV